MRPYAVLGLAMIACFGLGAAAVQALHAQTKPPLYQVTEIDVTDLDGYLKEYAPKAQALANAAGGRILAAGQEVSAIEGTPPKRRVVLVQWDSLDQLQAWRNSAQYKQDRQIGDKYATFRTFAVEGLTQ
jgi:uncharacterized protein (DUF1330 family)